jgi:electron transport complex protein RnfB
MRDRRAATGACPTDAELPAVAPCAPIREVPPREGTSRLRSRVGAGHRFSRDAARRKNARACPFALLPRTPAFFVDYNQGVETALVERIDAALPQTQCTRCGYEGCRPYAEAIAAGAADINRCPPGGDATIAILAALSGRRAGPLDAACGVHAPLRLAVVDESRCIGCTLCIDACPVDAIIGASKRMHAVLPDLCSGCELCVVPCPVDCITMIDASRPWTRDDADAARVRHRSRLQRLAANERIAERGLVAADADAAHLRRQAVAEALARARARRAGAQPPRR